MVLWRELFQIAEWEDRLGTADRSALQQAWGYGEAIRRRGHAVQRFELVDARGERRGLAQVLMRRLPGGLALALLLRGPVWLDAAAQASLEPPAMVALRRRLPRTLLIWQPDDADAAASRAGFRRVWTGPSTVWLDLRPPLSTLRQGLSGKWRNMLARAEAESIEVIPAAGGPLNDWFIEASDRQRQRVGYQGPSAAFIRAMAAANRASGGLETLVACHAGAPIAGILTVRHGQSATYYVGVTSDEGRRLKAHHRLLWTAVARRRAAGCTGFDLGGVDTVKSPGIARFKLGLGGAPLTLAGSYLLPPRWRRNGIATIETPSTVG